MSGSFFNPIISSNFLDTCAFDPKTEPEASCAREIFQLYEAAKVRLVLSHTNQKEMEHPNTPAEVKREVASMIFTTPVSLTAQEKQLLSKIHLLLTGNALPSAHWADANHIFESIKYVGCFITTDKRILSKKTELEGMGAKILTPCEWMSYFSSI